MEGGLVGLVMAAMHLLPKCHTRPEPSRDQTLTDPKSPPLPPGSGDKHEPLTRLCARPLPFVAAVTYKHMALAALADGRWMRCRCICPIVAAHPESTPSASQLGGPVRRVMHGIRRHEAPLAREVHAKDAAPRSQSAFAGCD
jgi:hypothetical protein